MAQQRFPTDHCMHSACMEAEGVGASLGAGWAQVALASSLKFVWDGCGLINADAQDLNSPFVYLVQFAQVDSWPGMLVVAGASANAC